MRGFDRINYYLSSLTVSCKMSPCDFVDTCYTFYFVIMVSSLLICIKPKTICGTNFKHRNKTNIQLHKKLLKKRYYHTFYTRYETEALRKTYVQAAVSKFGLACAFFVKSDPYQV